MGKEWWRSELLDTEGKDFSSITNSGLKKNSLGNTSNDKSFNEVFGSSFDDMPLRQQIETAYDYYDKPQSENSGMKSYTLQSKPMGFAGQTKRNMEPNIDGMKTTHYPVLRNDKRNILNSGIERFVKSTEVSVNDNGFSNQIVGAMRDLGENYINMINANYKSTPEMQRRGQTIDNYYHCKANYEAAKRGNIGAVTAAGIGVGRELFDYPKNLLRNKSFAKANDDFKNDLNVNADARKMADSDLYNSSFEACDKYRPPKYDPLEQFKYYQK